MWWPTAWWRRRRIAGWAVPDFLYLEDLAAVRLHPLFGIVRVGDLAIRSAPLVSWPHDPMTQPLATARNGRPATGDPVLRDR